MWALALMQKVSEICKILKAVQKKKTVTAIWIQTFKETNYSSVIYSAVVHQIHLIDLKMQCWPCIFTGTLIYLHAPCEEKRM